MARSSRRIMGMSKIRRRWSRRDVVPRTRGGGEVPSGRKVALPCLGGRESMKVWQFVDSRRRVWSLSLFFCFNWFAMKKSGGFGTSNQNIRTGPFSNPREFIP